MASLEAVAGQGVEILSNFPKSSPDLNHIEGVWHLLKRELTRW